MACKGILTLHALLALKALSFRGPAPSNAKSEKGEGKGLLFPLEGAGLQDC